MRFTSAIASAVLAATALAAPSTSLANIPSIADAQAHGVDVFGPIPSDAVMTPEGYYTAEEGTQAWRWIRAQIDVPSGAHADEAKVNKRQGFSSIGVGVFGERGCRGRAVWVNDVVYARPQTLNYDVYSYGIGNRGLRADEALDFYTWNSVNSCGNWVVNAPLQAPIGCYNSSPVRCFTLWQQGVGGH